VVCLPQGRWGNRAHNIDTPGEEQGLVIDACVRVSLIGIELLTIDARIVIASVDTYLRFAEAVGRLDLREDASQGLPELMEWVISGGAKSKTQGALEGVKQTLLGSDDDEDQEKPRARRSSSSRRRKSS
jgi:gas vesicle structural protein